MLSVFFLLYTFKIIIFTKTKSKIKNVYRQLKNSQRKIILYYCVEIMMIQTFFFRFDSHKVPTWSNLLPETTLKVENPSIFISYPKS